MGLTFNPNKMTHYHNTNNESGEVLQKSIKKAETQESTILAFFVAHPMREYTCEEIMQILLPNSPLTSTRRAISNLTKSGELEKTDKMAVGSFGKSIYKWRLNFKKELF